MVASWIAERGLKDDGKAVDNGWVRDSVSHQAVSLLTITPVRRIHTLTLNSVQDKITEGILGKPWTITMTNLCYAIAYYQSEYYLHKTHKQTKWNQRRWCNRIFTHPL